MRKVWGVFKSDVRKLTSNVVTVTIVLGLVVLPSLFSWYNILACWDVFGNTGNLTVAVANSDAGYESDLVPTEVNIGDQLTSALRENDQLNWVFTDEEDAIDGVSSGRYYAAVVIPESFSRDMMSFYSDDVEHAKIRYYSNQKKSAIAPKVTDQGADQISNQVNTVFAQTISEIAIGLASTVLDYAAESDADGRLANLSAHLQAIGNQLDNGAATVTSYSTLVGSTQSLIQNSADLLKRIRSSADEVVASVGDAKTAAAIAVDAMEHAVDELAAALENSEASYGEFTESVDAAFAKADARAGEAEDKLREAAQKTEALELDTLTERLTAAADAIQQANADTQASRTEVQQQVERARDDLIAARQQLSGELRPSIDSISGIVADAKAAVARASDVLDEAGSSIAGTTATLSDGLGSTQGKLDDAASDLTASARNLDGLAADVSGAIESQDIQALRDIIGSDPAALAHAVAAPVELERTALYPAETFGTAMAPLYTTLALWIGSLLIMVAFKTRPSESRLEEMGNPSSRQVFMGRFLVVALVSLMQSTLLSVGNLLFLQIHAVSPLLYVLCFWVAGLVFAFIIYTFVALFANLGKALGVILLIIQVAGGGGSFPLQLLPSFFQDMSPYLPIAHAVRAMRAAMFGLYNGDFWIELGALLLFVVPMAILGLALHYPLGKIVPIFLERVEKSKLM